MKSVLSEQTPQDSKPTYPCLKRYVYPYKDGNVELNFIVLFTKLGVGTVVWVDEKIQKNSPVKRHIGEYGTDWYENSFKLINETVILSND